MATHHALTKCQEKGEKPTEEILQKSLDGNLCRCTGYRPILDACKVRHSLPLALPSAGVHCWSSRHPSLPQLTCFPDTSAVIAGVAFDPTAGCKNSLSATASMPAHVTNHCMILPLSAQHQPMPKTGLPLSTIALRTGCCCGVPWLALLCEGTPGCEVACTVLQSLVAGVDMEDLGVRSCSTPFKAEPLRQAHFPDHLKQYVKARSPIWLTHLPLHTAHSSTLSAVLSAILRGCCTPLQAGFYCQCRQLSAALILNTESCLFLRCSQTPNLVIS